MEGSVLYWAVIQLTLLISFAELKEKPHHCSRKMLEGDPKFLKSRDAAMVKVPNKSMCQEASLTMLLWLILLNKQAAAAGIATMCAQRA